MLESAVHGLGRAVRGAGPVEVGQDVGGATGQGPATIRTQLINVPARVANHARKWRLHLPAAWPWQTAWENLFRRAHETATAIA